MAPQLTIDGRELELETPAPRTVAPAPEGLFALEAFAQLSGQRALELEELEPRAVACPRCSAGVGSPCSVAAHPVHGAGIHAPRVRDAQRAAQGLEPYMAPDAAPKSPSEPERARERVSCSPADPVHRAKMDAGRERAQHERDHRAVARVEAWRRWSRAGGRGPMPELPRDSDFATARAHGSQWAS